MTISAIIIFLYGGMLYGIFPATVEANVSWESHLMGGIVGLLLAFLFRKTAVVLNQKEVIDGEETNKPEINHTSVNRDIEIHYEYKPNDKNSS